MDLDPTLVTWLFFVGGLVLMLLETLVPGGVSFFLGIGGLTVAALRAVGILVDPLTALVAWVFVSTGLTLALRPVAMRYFGGDTSVGITNEDAEAIGNVVTVVEPVGEDEAGRIRFRGATWDARSIEGRLPEGAHAQLLYRDNLTWIVEPTDHADLDQELADAIGADALDDVPSSREDLDESDFEARRREHDPSVQPGGRQQTE
jgi:membrane protein implicated in regulation of membrane protease activity